MKIEKPETHLYDRYPGQQPQGTYLELDCDEGILRAESDPEIGGAIPMSVYHGCRRRWHLPSVYLTAQAIGQIMDEIAPLCERVLAGYSSEWDGNNHVGRLVGDAVDAADEIDAAMQPGRVVGDAECIQVWDASEYYSATHDDVVDQARQMTDEDLEQWLVDESEVDILEGIDHYIRQIREQIAEEDS
jgi:hypothetical protein